jgi:putative membrane protein
MIPLVQYICVKGKNMRRHNYVRDCALALIALSMPVSAFAVSPKEIKLVQDIARDGMAEVALGKIAEKKASNADVKSFAGRMVTDHSKANDDLKAAAKKEKVELPSEVSPAQKHKVDTLSALSGTAFDDKYMAEMVKGHEKAVAALEEECKIGTGDLKAWAEEHLPTIKDHDKAAKVTDDKISKKP